MRDAPSPLIAPGSRWPKGYGPGPHQSKPLVGCDWDIRNDKARAIRHEIASSMPKQNTMVPPFVNILTADAAQPGSKITFHYAPRASFTRGVHDLSTSHLSKASVTTRVDALEGQHWENMLVRSNFMEMAESSTGGGGGVSRPYGTFVAARRGDGCALWQRVPIHQLPARNKLGMHGSDTARAPRRRYDFFPGSTIAATRSARVDLAMEATGGRNVTALNVARRAFLARREREGGIHIASKIHPEGRDLVLGDERDVETAQYTQPRESSLCPPQCKPGCWMCFRNAENTKDTHIFLTQLPKHANQRPLPAVVIYDRFGRAVPNEPSRASSPSSNALSEYSHPPPTMSSPPAPPHFTQRTALLSAEEEARVAERRVRTSAPSRRSSARKLMSALPSERSLPSPGSRQGSGRLLAPQ